MVNEFPDKIYENGSALESVKAMSEKERD